MTQTISRKRSRELEDSDLLPSPKRIDYNFNSALRVNGQLNGYDEADGSSRFSQNGACYDGQSIQAQPQHSPGQHPPPSLLHPHMNGQILPTNNQQSNSRGTYLDSSTCAALSNLHLMSGDHTEAPSCSSRTQVCDHSAYTDINRVLREAHFSRLTRLNGTFGE